MFIVGGNMANKIAIQFSGVNLPGEVLDEMTRLLADLPKHVDLYHLEPPEEPPSSTEEPIPEDPAIIILRKRRFYAAFDWTIVAAIADVVGIASFLWLLYEKVIMPRRREEQVHDAYTIPTENEGLYISIDPEKGLQWFLGKDYTDREAFITDFQVKFSEYHQTDEANEKFDGIAADIRISGLWKLKN
jgi:hypothetical protein